MSDRYQSLIQTSIGQKLAKSLGLPNPVVLDRFRAGDPLVQGTVLIGGKGRFTRSLPAALDKLGIPHTKETDFDGEKAPRFKGLVFDATDIESTEQLVALQEFFTPVLRRLEKCARVVVLGTPPELLADGARVAQRALEGFTRSLGKEIGRGGTVQLVYVAPKAEAATASTLAFLLSPKSAYVNGQVIRVGTKGATTRAKNVDWAQPLAGQVAVVTGASRGIGEQIARVLHRDGATVVGIDVPQAASELQTVMKEIDGEWLTLDITAPDAAARISRYLLDNHGGADVIVHNAGITRDKKLANMKSDGFASAIAVNLTAPERITATLLENKAIRNNGRIIGVASIAGIAGNVGQTNYAASKAGVIGLVDALAEELKDGITINAVAPGFIATKMTAAVPLLTREVGARMNTLSQAGEPVDVAETIAWFASPASGAVNGNVVRVCGQMMLGA